MGVGTSLFLKNTTEQVLQTWGWERCRECGGHRHHLGEGTAPRSADLILTSGEIARTLGDVGIPVQVVDNFTSTTEVDAALRDSYDVLTRRTGRMDWLVRT